LLRQLGDVRSGTPITDALKGEVNVSQQSSRSKIFQCEQRHRAQKEHQK